MKNFIAILLVVFTAIVVNAQDRDTANFNLETVVGLNFSNEALTILNQEQLFTVDLQPEDYLRFQVIPKINFLPYGNKFAIGAHLGFGYESFKIRERNNQRVTSKLFKLGGQLQYEILNFHGFRPYLELGSNYNIYEASAVFADTDETINYFKSYVDIGIRLEVNSSIDVSLLLKDFLTYHSNSTNFERAEDFNVRHSLQDFLEFTHFSITFNL
ncbi:hypothetical protein F0365_01540 [Nonlabens sp. Ci31]|uniref:hypothetical protein n=1 Tax=Nonlabens sp. Ci31 TaxID=2608253 RepID=UPI0014644697|nr:hypothetical protein [Nonlabens sp. Ci31]QJP33185.1 hypothetical protein F0365_01540 [Nonlabens sp. Ci31]